MVIAKLRSNQEYTNMFLYLDPIKETVMSSFSTFVRMCQKGRSYGVFDKDGVTVGSLCMYETSTHIFVAHMHLNKEYRKTKAAVLLYTYIVKYARDKHKKVYTTMDDIKDVEHFLVPSGIHSNGDTLYEIDINKKIMGKDIYELFYQTPEIKR